MTDQRHDKSDVSATAGPGPCTAQGGNGAGCSGSGSRDQLVSDALNALAWADLVERCDGLR